MKITVGLLILILHFHTSLLEDPEYHFKQPIRFYRDIRRAKGSMLPDGVCDLIEDERQQLCEEAIPACAKYNITLIPVPDGKLGEKKMYKLVVKIKSDEQPKEIVVPGLKCPTDPPIYIGKSVAYGYVHTMIERKYCPHKIEDVF